MILREKLFGIGRKYTQLYVMILRKCGPQTVDIDAWFL